MELYLVTWTAARTVPTDDPIDYVGRTDLVMASNSADAQLKVMQYVHEEEEDLQVVHVGSLRWTDLLEIVASDFDFAMDEALAALGR